MHFRRLIVALELCQLLIPPQQHRTGCACQCRLREGWLSALHQTACDSIAQAIAASVQTWQRHMTDARHTQLAHVCHAVQTFESIAPPVTVLLQGLLFTRHGRRWPVKSCKAMPPPSGFKPSGLLVSACLQHCRAAFATVQGLCQSMTPYVWQPESSCCSYGPCNWHWA